jgi:AraC family transcriptional regulator of adaptative response / DNA-3-methyladenine glycosylase II
MLTAGSGVQPDPGVMELQLTYRGPMDVPFALRWLGWHAVAGVELFTDDGPTYARTLDLPHAPGRVWLEPGGPMWVQARLQLEDPRDLTTAVNRIRRLLDLDADPDCIDAALGSDPALSRLVRERPGMRSPGNVDGAETAVRTVVGQQVSLAGARTVLARIVAAHGQRVYTDEPGVLFPPAPTLGDVDPLTLPMPRARARAMVAVARAFADGDVVLDAGVDLAAVRIELLAIAGVGPWTADYLRMRSGDPDVLLATDLAARRISDRLGLDLSDGGGQWAPWRSYVTHHLWAVALTEMAQPKEKS